MRHKYVRVKLHGGNSYIHPTNNLLDALDGELDGVDIGDKITLDFEPVEMTDDEYKALPEFMGH